MMSQIRTLEHTNYSSARVPVLVAAVGADHHVCECGACPVLVDPKGSCSLRLSFMRPLFVRRG
jgi:hypothetical protein